MTNLQPSKLCSVLIITIITWSPSWYGPDFHLDLVEEITITITITILISTLIRWRRDRWEAVEERAPMVVDLLGWLGLSWWSSCSAGGGGFQSFNWKGWLLVKGGIWIDLDGYDGDFWWRAWWKWWWCSCQRWKPTLLRLLNRTQARVRPEKSFQQNNPFFQFTLFW